MVVSNERLSKLNVFISHGTHDNVLQVQYAHDALDYLKTKGITPEFHEYSESHTITEMMLNDVITWLSENIKNN